jgi:hypothetical protein
LTRSQISRLILLHYKTLSLTLPFLTQRVVEESLAAHTINMATVAAAAKAPTSPSKSKDNGNVIKRSVTLLD